MLGDYSKLIGSLVGSIVAIAVAYAVTKGIGSCTTSPEGTEVCSVWGFTSAQITGGLVAVISAVLVWAFPKNTNTTT